MGALEPGQRVTDRYEIVEKLGAGGMGVVYRARDTRLGREVALKMLPADLVGDATARARLIREARAAAALEAPGIVGIFDVGETPDGGAYIVMELIRGRSIRDFLGQDDLSSAAALRVATDVARSLGAAHRAGLLHRDVKPDNIMLRADGRTVLLDFGLAKGFAPELGDTAAMQSPGATQLTTEGTILGTPAYLAPEQLRGKSVGGHTDQFALAVTLYEMLTGQLPWRARSPTAMLAEILTEEPQPANSVRPALPEGVDELLVRAMAKRPEDRFASMEELAGALEAIREERVPDTGDKPPPSAPDADAATISAAHAVTRPSGTAPTSEPSKATRLRLAALIGLGAVAVFAVVTAVIDPPPGESGLATGSSSIPAPAGTASGTPTPSTSPTTIVILPFSVRGGDEVAYLGEGLVHLLSTKLDGAGELRTVDPRALLGHIARNGLAAADLEQASGVARHFDAGLFLLGDVFEAGGTLQLSAALYDLRPGGPREPARATVEGKTDEVFRIVDELAGKLLIGRPGLPGGGLARIAATTTESFPALKAYLEGETALRRVDLAGAREAFGRAVEEDPTFALAHYRLSITTSWTEERDASLDALARARKGAKRLPPRHRILIEAWSAHVRGAFAEAESGYRRALRLNTVDPEAWYQLGETLFHLGPLHGRSAAEALPVFEEMLRLEPDNRLALIHVISLAGVKRDTTLLESGVSRFLAIAAGATPIGAMRAYVLGTPEERTAFEDRLRTSPYFLSYWVAEELARFDLRTAEGVARLFTEPARSPTERAEAYLLLTHFQAARGRWGDALADLANVADLEPDLAMVHRAVLMLHPLRAATKVELESTRAALREWDVASVAPDGSKYHRVHEGVFGHVRAYLIGRLSVHLGDTMAAEHLADELERMKAPHYAGTLASDLALVLRAEVHWYADAPAKALAAIEAVRMEFWFDNAPESLFYAQTYGRYLRAEALRRLGRYDAALEWYEVLGQVAPIEIIYRVAADLRRAEIHERRVEKDEAAALYEEFISLWKDCDPSLRPIREEAEARLSTLGGR